MTGEEAVKAFKKMLSDLGVTATWRWEDAHRMIQGEERAKTLKTIHERKRAFQDYITEYKQREKDEARQKKAHVFLDSDQ
jgi:hypothetical protein